MKQGIDTEMKQEIETDIETYLKKKIDTAGGLCMKFTSPGMAGLPDRICLIDGKCFFVEVKRPGHRKRRGEELQKAVHAKIRKRGFHVYVISTKGDANNLMKYVEFGWLPSEEHFDHL